VNLDAFHLWLFDATKAGPMTVVEIMADIDTLRRGCCDVQGLPTDGITCQQWLTRLAEQGRAKRLNAAGQPDAAGS
jgi:hypothetical protein